MGFSEAIRVVFSKYVTFDGRARRSEYWYWALFTVLVSIVTSILDAVVGTSYDTGGGLINTIVGLALLLPGLAVAIRRLHDTGRVGWWVLIGIIPVIGWIVLIVFFVFDSKPGENKYGPSPKYATAV